MQSRQQWNRLPATNSPPAATVSIEDLMLAVSGGSEEKARVGDLIRSFGAITGTVVSSKPDGEHVIDIAGTRATLKLSTPHAVGETIVIALGKPGAESARGEVALSSTARMLATLLTDGKPAGDVRSEGVSPAPPVDIPAFAAALQHAIADSGLFYESHLAGWVQGRRSLTDIRREPQARSRTISAASEGDLPEELGSLVSRQLDTLDSGRVEWKGELWPGQKGEITLQEEPREPGGDSGSGDQAAQEPSATWRTRMRLQLPNIGEVEASLSLTGQLASVTLSTPANAGTILKVGTGELRSALEARGITMDSLVVRPHA